MTHREAVDKVRAVCLRRYPDYDKKGAKERVALAGGVMRDDFSIREVGGENRGEWVGVMLASVELGQGFRWCGGAVRFALDVAGVSTPGLSRRQTASVAEIKAWAIRTKRWRNTPIRGAGAIKRSGGVSHVGICLGKVPLLPRVRSVEGNTSSGAGGSQDNGDGFYGRVRSTGFWDGYVDWEE
jgi:hypothetical protein